ncbi:hypothetical protein QBC47DRAFT_408013 [Echria macrotheca]|uniref:Uncharacterized protein n=1 Tax=Echria macrotheca TaxID=438768 RepID=A0AAJ0F0Y8_9PEZI|nr:hypothetical protein QBC47DRAFT_408013 [Echria macrotheca]
MTTRYLVLMLVDDALTFLSLMSADVVCLMAYGSGIVAAILVLGVLTPIFIFSISISSLDPPILVLDSDHHRPYDLPHLRYGVIVGRLNPTIYTIIVIFLISDVQPNIPSIKSFSDMMLV